MPELVPEVPVDPLGLDELWAPAAAANANTAAKPAIFNPVVIFMLYLCWLSQPATGT